MQQDAEFKTRDGTRLRGIFYTPDGGGARHPCIVMSHGFTGQIEHGLFPFAEDLASAGFAVLLYDHRCWGRSDGEPRCETNPFLQLQDARDALTYVSLRADVDASRLGLWGTSYSGGNALVLAAVDRRIKCVLSLVPVVSGSQMARRAVGDLAFAEHLKRLDLAREAEARGDGVQYQPHSSNPETLGYFERADKQKTWQNRITVASHSMLMEYEPGDYIHRIAPTPLLMIVTTNDTRVGTDLQLEAYSRAREPKQIVIFEGHHYTPYIEHYDATAKAIREFFKKWL